MMCFLIATGVPYAHADDNASANKIFVETVKLLQRAAAAKPTEAIGLYEQALQNLDRIVATYPSSTLAVQLVSGQSIGHVSRLGIEQALLESRRTARQVECSQHLRAFCVLEEALEIAHSIEDSRERGMALGGIARHIAATQVEAGNMPAALDTVRSIEDSRLRAYALGDIAVAQAKTGNMPAALKTARSIEDSSLRVRVLSNVAETMVGLGLK